jgi:hypothetical protein
VRRRVNVVADSRHLSTIGIKREHTLSGSQSKYGRPVQDAMRSRTRIFNAIRVTSVVSRWCILRRAEALGPTLPQLDVTLEKPLDWHRVGSASLDQDRRLSGG